MEGYILPSRSTQPKADTKELKGQINSVSSEQAPMTSDSVSRRLFFFFLMFLFLREKAKQSMSRRGSERDGDT